MVQSISGEFVFMRIIEYIIDDEYSGRKIKDFLMRKCHMSGTLLKELKQYKDGITVDGKPRFVVDTLRKNDILRVTIHESASENITPVKGDFNILYEDEDIIVVEKPPHMPTHPSAGNYSNTLANALMYYWRQNGEEHVFRAVNRLDKDTSGVMCVAKNKYAHAVLCDEIKSKALCRSYMAIVTGDVKENGTVDAPIMRDCDSVIKRCVGGTSRAVTHYKVIERYGTYTLLALSLETGRTHQIRVHMSHIGHPLLGDWLYGEENHSLFDRQALHSCNLRLIHPVTEKKMEFSSDLPRDMKEFLLTQK